MNAQATQGVSKVMAQDRCEQLVHAIAALVNQAKIIVGFNTDKVMGIATRPISELEELPYDQSVKKLEAAYNGIVNVIDAFISHSAIEYVDKDGEPQMPRFVGDVNRRRHLKGVVPEMIQTLDDQLAHLQLVIEQEEGLGFDRCIDAYNAMDAALTNFDQELVQRRARHKQEREDANNRARAEFLANQKAKRREHAKNLAQAFFDAVK